MTSLAVTLKAIDVALVTKYTGLSINTGTPPVATSITAFIEDPDPEVYSERTYPSISIKLISMIPDYSGIYESEDLNEEETDYDPTETPPVRSMRKKPLPFRLAYSLDTWHKARVGESRDLVTEALIYNTDPRGYLTVSNIDGVNIPIWMFWQGGVTSVDEYDVDEVIYHKSLTVVVLAYVAQVAFDDVSEEKVVTELNLDVSSRHTWRDEDGFHVDDSKNVKDVSIRVTDTDVEVIP